jgi:hypothetical protein
VNKTILEGLIKVQENFQTSLSKLDSEMKSIKETSKFQQNQIESNSKQMKESDSLLKNLNNVHIPMLSEGLNNTIKRQELSQFKNDLLTEVFLKCYPLLNIYLCVQYDKCRKHHYLASP